MFVSKFTDNVSGLTFAVKDNIDVIGSVSGMGCAAYKNVQSATRSAHVIQRLIDSDFQMVGKLVMHELAFGMTGVNNYSGCLLYTSPSPRD